MSTVQHQANAAITSCAPGSVNLARIAAAPLPVDGGVLLVLQQAGTSHLTQAARAATLNPGDLALVDAAQPFSWQPEEASQCLLARFDTDKLARHLHRFPVAWPLAGGQPATRILARVLEIVWEEALVGPVPGASQIILEALDLALQRPASTPGTTLFQRALEIINRELLEPELSVGDIAAQLGISPRYLQRLFAQRGTTPRAEVAHKRIQYAAQLLCEERASVTGAAMEAGFNDLSHFGRLFRKTFGETPRDYRRRRLAPA